MTWSREELLEAFDAYQARVTRCVETGDWSHYVDSFVPDATYVEHAYGRFSGRDEIKQWVTRTMTSFPGSEMTSFPPKWTTVDTDKGRIITEVDNPMRDPGDGSAHAMGNLTILRYAGNGLFREQEDVYNPMEFFSMAGGYVKACAENGTLSEDARRWAEKYGVDFQVGAAAGE